ncbi:MAG: hypothetical protein HYZ44_13590 [Bacteroidetes bacterium]|nr:hypothetical protein [Bacteroidota bacterium]
MNRFRKEKFSDWEKKSLKEKYSLKGIWLTLGVLLSIGLIGSFIFPFLPRRRMGHWNPPTNQQEYSDQVVTNLIFLPLFIFSILIFVWLRSTIDLALGYKRLGDFEVTKVIYLGHLKILVLDHWRLFDIKKRGDYFQTVKEGQQIQIKRTATHRLINYYVYDKKVSTQENVN